MTYRYSKQRMAARFPTMIDACAPQIAFLNRPKRFLEMTLNMVEPGQLFAEADRPEIVWRVDQLLADGVHVRLVRTDQPSRFKTYSLWVLTRSAFFVPVARSAGAE